MTAPPPDRKAIREQLADLQHQQDFAATFNHWMRDEVEGHSAIAGHYSHEQLRTLMYLAFQAGAMLMHRAVPEAVPVSAASQTGLDAQTEIEYWRSHYEAVLFKWNKSIQRHHALLHVLNNRVMEYRAGVGFGRDFADTIERELHRSERDVLPVCGAEGAKQP